MRPVKIKIIDRKNLFVKWDDGTESEIAPDKLRKHCPCATCLAEREKRSKTYISILNENQVRISGITQIGSYAIGLTFKDGHDTGIYEYTFLRKLADLPDQSFSGK